MAFLRGILATLYRARLPLAASGSTQEVTLTGSLASTGTLAKMILKPLTGVL